MKTIPALLLATALTLTACTQTTNSMFGDDRSQMMLVSSAELNAQAAQAYRQVLAQARAQRKLNTDRNNSARVKRISQKLITVAPTLRSDCRSWHWEINTITDPTVNAWCMPGGKIVVYTGIIRSLQLTDDELAAVIGHEISHALKEHSREQASKAKLQSGLTTLASLVGVNGNLTSAANSAYNTFIAQSFSRSQESEADKLGVELMYKAGYDPQAAVTLMRKMSRLEDQSGSNAGLNALLGSFTRTHPTGEQRYKDLQALIDKYELRQKRR